MSEPPRTRPLEQDLAPSMSELPYVFCSLPDAGLADAAGLCPVATVQEREGLSVVIEQAVAERAGLLFEGCFRRISLGAQTSLDGVGLTARAAAALAREGISANVVAGHYHDHFFVPDDRAGDALRILQALSVSARDG